MGVRRIGPAKGAPMINRNRKRHTKAKGTALSRAHRAPDMKSPAELYRASRWPYRGLAELEYPFHDRTITVTHCGPQTDAA